MDNHSGNPVIHNMDSVEFDSDFETQSVMSDFSIISEEADEVFLGMEEVEKQSGSSISTLELDEEKPSISTVEVMSKHSITLEADEVLLDMEDTEEESESPVPTLELVEGKPDCSITDNLNLWGKGQRGLEQGQMTLEQETIELLHTKEQSSQEPSTSTKSWTEDDEVEGVEKLEEIETVEGFEEIEEIEDVEELKEMKKVEDRNNFITSCEDYIYQILEVLNSPFDPEDIDEFTEMKNTLCNLVNQFLVLTGHHCKTEDRIKALEIFWQMERDNANARLGEEIQSKKILRAYLEKMSKESEMREIELDKNIKTQQQQQRVLMQNALVSKYKAKEYQIQNKHLRMESNDLRAKMEESQATVCQLKAHNSGLFRDSLGWEIKATELELQNQQLSTQAEDLERNKKAAESCLIVMQAEAKKEKEYIQFLEGEALKDKKTQQTLTKELEIQRQQQCTLIEELRRNLEVSQGNLESKTQLIKKTEEILEGVIFGNNGNMGLIAHMQKHEEECIQNKKNMDEAKISLTAMQIKSDEDDECIEILQDKLLKNKETQQTLTEEVEVLKEQVENMTSLYQRAYLDMEEKVAKHRAAEAVYRQDREKARAVKEELKDTRSLLEDAQITTSIIEAELAKKCEDTKELKGVCLSALDEINELQSQQSKIKEIVKKYYDDSQVTEFELAERERELEEASINFQKSLKEITDDAMKKEEDLEAALEAEKRKSELYSKESSVQLAFILIQLVFFIFFYTFLKLFIL